MRVTDNSIDKVIVDGAYQSKENRNLASDEENGFELVANGLQGKPSRFDLELQDDGSFEVTDKQTAEVITATKVKDGQWKIAVESPKGKKSYRYFDNEAIERSQNRQRMETIPWEERKKRNNVEATIFQYCFLTRNNKTRYRGLFTHASSESKRPTQGYKASLRSIPNQINAIFSSGLKNEIKKDNERIKDRISAAA